MTCRFDIIRESPDSQTVFCIKDASIGTGDSANVVSSADKAFRYTNSSEATKYTVRIEIASSTVDTVYFHDSVSICANCTHIVSPDWRNSDDSLIIYVDSIPGGTYEDTLFLSNERDPEASCCSGTTGNVNMTGIVDLSDLSALVSYLTGGGYVLPCQPEANVNAVGIVDLSDLSALVSYLTGGGYVLPNCP